MVWCDCSVYFYALCLELEVSTTQVNTNENNNIILSIDCIVSNDVVPLLLELSASFDLFSLCVFG